MRDNQAANGIIGDNATGIADDMGFAGLQPQQILDIQARIHACHYSYTSGRLNWL